MSKRPMLSNSESNMDTHRNKSKKTTSPNVANETLFTVKTKPAKEMIYVDVIVPVYNASETIRETITSSIHQIIPPHLKDILTPYDMDIAICCYDDGSTDDSYETLEKLQQKLGTKIQQNAKVQLSYQILIGKSHNGISRGAGYARNQAVALRSKCSINTNDSNYHFICLLDSDDVMKPTRIAEQVSYFISYPNPIDRDRILLGTQFSRDPPDSTWHYANWANQLTDERLHLEKFREVTIVQPTWMMTKTRFTLLGGYIEAPSLPSVLQFDSSYKQNRSVMNHDANIHERMDCEESRKNKRYKLIHPKYDTPQTLRLAEDLRFFHAHLSCQTSVPQHLEPSTDLGTVAATRIGSNHDRKGLLRLLRTSEPLLIYRHRKGMSQSASTSRKLLLQLRVKAFEDEILAKSSHLHDQDHPKTKSLDTISWRKFVIWGAGRDGKDFLKALDPKYSGNVLCFVDVDWKKIEQVKFYVNKDINVNIPIVHFSELAKDPNVRKNWIVERQRLQQSKTLSNTKKQRKDPLNHETLGKNHSDSVTFGRITKGKVSKSIDHVFNLPNATTDSTCDNSATIESKSNIQETIDPNGVTHNNIDTHNNNSKLWKETIISDIPLSSVPVVVCVAMYRTDGALEKNVLSIGRKEGYNLWHFS